MTRISYIHGIPANERADRGRMVQTPAKLPYLMLTAGEARLRLLQDRAEMLAAAYPEIRAYKQASDMLKNALNYGVHKGINFTGSISEPLQQIAREIRQAENNLRPAAGVLYKRNPMVSGINADSVLTVNCERYAEQRALDLGYYPAGSLFLIKFYEIKADCQRRQKIENIVNDSVVKASHHTLYYGIPSAYPMPSRVYSKHLYHLAGVEGLSAATGLDNKIMQLWTENSIIARNSQSGAGVIGSVQSSLYLSPDPEATWAAYVSGNSGNPKKDKMKNQVGFLPAVIAIVAAITAALTAAAELLKSLRKEDFAALSQATGYGTEAFKSEQSDWPSGTTTPKDGTTTNTGLLIGAGVLAAGFFLMNDNDTKK